MTNHFYNPNADLNAELEGEGLSKTVYALVTPETEAAKDKLLGNTKSPERRQYYDNFRQAWTQKQNDINQRFFSTWLHWCSSVTTINHSEWEHRYPTAGASEALKHLIYDQAARTKATGRVHVFAGEYEGYEAVAKAAGLAVIAHDRGDWQSVAGKIGADDLFFLSQPSAIDGNLWNEFQTFISGMPANSVVTDVTYIGAVPAARFAAPIDLTGKAIRNIVFSLSKPFGVYYDRIGGVLCRQEDPGLYGSIWFKNITSLLLGTQMMEDNHVTSIADKYSVLQEAATRSASKTLGVDLTPSDVMLLATGKPDPNKPLVAYLTRAGSVRVCLTHKMADAIGTGGKA